MNYGELIMTNEETAFCSCGLPLETKLDGKQYCKKHSDKIMVVHKRTKIGAYSGKSHRPFGKYEDY